MAKSGTGMRCVLCGEPNDCARAAALGASAGRMEGAVGGSAGATTGAASVGAAEEPCWCVGRTFPPALLERATAVDGGAACVCRRCLAAASAERIDAPEAAGG
jgi:hypothetical protein